jgi:hypothetical protein
VDRKPIEVSGFRLVIVLGLLCYAVLAPLQAFMSLKLS